MTLTDNDVPVVRLGLRCFRRVEVRGFRGDGSLTIQYADNMCQQVWASDVCGLGTAQAEGLTEWLPPVCLGGAFMLPVVVGDEVQP